VIEERPDHQQDAQHLEAFLERRLDVVVHRVGHRLHRVPDLEGVERQVDVDGGHLDVPLRELLQHHGTAEIHDAGHDQAFRCGLADPAQERDVEETKHPRQDRERQGPARIDAHVDDLVEARDLVDGHEQQGESDAPPVAVERLAARLRPRAEECRQTRLPTAARTTNTRWGSSVRRRR
jgi:hypothetical protein